MAVREKVVYIGDKRKRDDDDGDESSEEEQGKRVFVGNLPDSTTREYLINFLGEDFMKGVAEGGIKLARDARDRQSFKGYAFVTFETKEQADEMVEKRNGKYWKQGPERNDRSRKVNVQISPFFTKRGRCFWCGSKDHLTNACKRDVRGHTGSICYRCNQTGHLVKDCPKAALAKKNKEEREKERAENKKKWEEAKKEAGHSTTGDKWAKKQE
eukprot:TRINITY_DN5532_c0_g1_i4.p2 TRINITY_DN5532_c0_g1~~TRINITY_DN5532_c0_g1_i4.p2  ORF type:complete len:233 (+),score=108.97 TRINITY_DN5532_c0_g1_i4:62-700(+)